MKNSILRASFCAYLSFAMAFILPLHSYSAQSTPVKRSKPQKTSIEEFTRLAIEGQASPDRTVYTLLAIGAPTEGVKAIYNDLSKRWGITKPNANISLANGKITVNGQESGFQVRLAKSEIEYGGQVWKIDRKKTIEQNYFSYVKWLDELLEQKKIENQKHQKNALLNLVLPPAHADQQMIKDYEQSGFGWGLVAGIPAFIGVAAAGIWATADVGAGLGAGFISGMIGLGTVIPLTIVSIISLLLVGLFGAKISGGIAQLREIKVEDSVFEALKAGFTISCSAEKMEIVAKGNLRLSVNKKQESHQQTDPYKGITLLRKADCNQVHCYDSRPNQIAHSITQEESGGGDQCTCPNEASSLTEQLQIHIVSMAKSCKDGADAAKIMGQLNQIAEKADSILVRSTRMIKDGVTNAITQ